MTFNSLVIINKFCVIGIQGIPLVFAHGVIPCKLVLGLLLQVFNNLVPMLHRKDHMC